MKTLDVVLPVYNEEDALRGSVLIVRDFLQKNMHTYKWRIVIANNGSTDGTHAIAQALATQFSHDVYHLDLDLKGRGRSLKKAWVSSDADILSYMDVDLSTDLRALPELISAVANEHCDIAIGSRLMSGAHVSRSFKREFLSRGYNLLTRGMFLLDVSDAQCGFKAITQQVAVAVVDSVRDNDWFFDTELLILAKRRGFQIKEIPVDWHEDYDSRVRIISTVLQDLKGLFRLRFGRIRKRREACNTTGPNSGVHPSS